jgi:hypothetical protein
LVIVGVVNEPEDDASKPDSIAIVGVDDDDDGIPANNPDVDGNPAANTPDDEALDLCIAVVGIGTLMAVVG